MFSIRRFFLLGCALLVLCGQIAEAAPLLLKGKPVHPTRIIAKLKANNALAAKAHATAIDAQGLKAIKQPALVPGLTVLDVLDQKILAALALAAPPEQARQLQARIDALKQSGLYEYVEPDYIMHATLTPTDSKFVDGTLWGLRNTGQLGGVSNVDVGTVQAWDVTTGSTNVIIAVIDTGIRYTHHELAAQMWHDPGNVNIHGINAVAGTSDPMDDAGHGTHVSGTIGAGANDGYPIAGVCWHVQLMACKFLGADGQGNTSDAITCVNYAVAHGARILNNSWGGSGYSQGLYDAIAAAGTHGVLFVAAAGNDGVNNDGGNFYPANYALDNIVCVAAIDRQDKLASFSNYGRHSVHLGAPGVSIYSSYFSSDSSYATLDGTSMATPHVSGVAGLVLAQFPNLSAQDLKSKLLNTVVVTPALLNTTITGGRVNAYKALTATPSGSLQAVLSTDFEDGQSLLAGSQATLFVRVNDLVGVTNATVTASSPSVSSLNFVNNGVSPDQTANDAVYTASILVPTNTDPISITVIANAPGKIGVTNSYNLTVIPPPPNDAFTNRISLSGTGAIATGSNIGGSKEAGEPTVCNNAGGKSVWWTWTAPASGLVTISTEGSTAGAGQLDTILGVYTGNAVGSLSQVATNDDIGTNDVNSTVSFQTAAGATYQIVVDGYDGSEGAITLNVSLNGNVAAPLNDQFAHRTLISGASLTVTGSNTGASKEAGEPTPTGNAGGKSVWWSWTAPGNGQVTVSTANSGFDTILGVYTGTAVNALSLVADNDDDLPLHTSLLTFDAVVGTSYQIEVDGYNGASGSVTLSVNFSGSVIAPTNDNFANRILITGASNTVSGYNIGASKEVGEPDHAGNSGGASVWWTWTAPNSQIVTIQTAGSTFHTALGIYTGDSVSNLTEVASDMGSGTNHSSTVTFSPAVGTTYQIAVDGENDGFGAATGTVLLQVAPLLVNVTNDMFARRITITGLTNTVSGSNVGASLETGEPALAGKPGGASVWWSWTPTVSGKATVSTLGSSFDTLLGVFTGNTVSNLTEVASDDDSGSNITSLVTFHAVAGTPYRIAVDGLNGIGGHIVLHVGLTPAPANDLFARRIALSGALRTIYATNTGAGHEIGESDHADHVGGASVWWSWTSPSNGPVTISTVGSSFDTLLEIYTGTTLANLTPVTADDDSGGNGTSLVTFTAVKGTVYQIAVDGKNGADGALVLRIAVVPSNDLFAKRILFSGGSNVLSGYNIAAGKESGEPNHAGNIGGASVWWSWTAPSNGVAMMTTEGSSFGTLLAVYTGSTVSGLTTVTSDANDTSDMTSAITFNAVAGTTYQIAVDGDNGATGSIVLNSRLFTSPAVITGQPVSVHATTNTAVKFTVTATGTKPLTYQWSMNGNPVVNATNSILSLAHAQLADGGSYVVVVGNPAGTATSATATLTMAREMVLPVVTITGGPAANARTTSPVVTFQGKASDNSGVAQIVYQVNGGSFMPATGTTAWSALVTNVPGTNTFVVKAIDGNTNESLAVTRKFVYVVTNGIVLITNAPGTGTIKASFTGTNLEVGRSYTVTATAKAGFLFSNWSGTISSNSAALNFIMQSNMVLSANFMTNPFSAIKGGYNVLFYETNAAEQSSGFATLTLTDSGAYSGQVMINGGTFPVAGSFDLTGNSQATVTRAKTNALTALLQLNLGSLDDKIAGTVSDGVWKSPLSGYRSVFNETTNKATNFVVSYTMAIPGGGDVGGDGYATLMIDAAGMIRMVGKLGEGTSISQSASVSKDGRWPLYVSLYAGTGSVLGWINFSNQPASVLGGSVNWIKPAQATTLYPTAFSETTTVVGSSFHTPSVSTSLLVSFGNGSVILSGGNLSVGITNSATINPTSIIVSSTNHVTLTLNRTSGLISGSFTHPDLHKVETLTGVILQEQDMGRGFFIGTNQSGSFLLQTP